MEIEQPKPSDLAESPRKTHSIQPSSPSDRRDVDGKHQPSWSTQTPKKLPQLPPRALQLGYSDQTRKLPDDYEMLLRLFTGLNTAIRLLRMRKSAPVFSKIKKFVESITERRFTHGHLAQMKFLMQEEIAIRKVSSRDEETGCMKCDLLVSLKHHHGEKEKKRKHGMNDDVFSLKKLFRRRLQEFLRAHPEGTEIPEENLPGPFNEQNQTNGRNSVSKVPAINVVAPDMKLTAASHIPKSFRRHFSRRISEEGQEGETSYCQLANKTVQALALVALETCPDSQKDSSIETLSLPETPVVNCLTKEGSNEAGKNETVMNLSSPGSLLKTPNLYTPPRKICGQNSNDTSMKKTRKLDSRPSCARSLRFDSAIETANIELELVDAQPDDIVDVIPQGLLQSLREKEEKKKEWRRLSPLMINNLPKLFDRIYYLFQSHKYSTIRKEQLLHTLTTCHGDITDHSEVLKQFKVLQEVIPEWISEKLSPPSRNIFLSIDKALDPCTLRARVNQVTMELTSSS